MTQRKVPRRPPPAQVRAHVLNVQLAGDFRHWYPASLGAGSGGAHGVAFPTLSRSPRLPWPICLSRSRRCIKDAAARL